MIMLSGNYNFFNFLYLALCLSLADNSWLEVRRPLLTYSAPVITDIIITITTLIIIDTTISRSPLHLLTCSPPVSAAWSTWQPMWLLAGP